MARIKKDHSNWNGDKDYKIAFDKIRERPIGKNTPITKRNYTKWCKGRVGKEHTYQKVEQVNASNNFLKRRFRYECTRCKKRAWAL